MYYFRVYVYIYIYVYSVSGVWVGGGWASVSCENTTRCVLDEWCAFD